MYWVYSIHSGHAGRGADAITNFYDWGIASRGLEGGGPPKNWFSPKVSEPSADVYVTSEAGKLVAVLPDLSNLRTDEAHLWISHGVFLNNDQKFAPEHLDFEVEGVHEYWKRLPLNTDGSADIWQDDPQLPALITSGALYKRTGRQEEPGSHLRRIALAARLGQAREPNAYLNPLVLRFPIDGSLDQTRDDLDCRTSESVLDIHPGPGSGDLLRLKMHAMIWQEWSRSLAPGNKMPAVPRLLFGDGCPKEAIAMFPLLDLLGGTFALDNAADGGTMIWKWHSTSKVMAHRDLLWLAKRCTDLLGIELVETAAQLKGALPKPTSEYSRHLRDDLKHHVTSGDFAGTELDEALERADVPRLVRAVATSGGSGDEICRRAAALASESGFPHFRFVEEVGRDLLLPLSPILVGLPAPPKWLSIADQGIWQDFRSKNALSLLISPLAAASWWFKLLDPTIPRPPDRGSAWIAENSSWWWAYYSALFRRPHDYAPEWEEPRGSGDLNKDMLGKFILGGVGVADLGKNIVCSLKVRLLAEGRE